MSGLDKQTVGNALGGGAVGFGALAVLAPQLMARTYGLPGNPHFSFMTRLWGTRTLAFGAMYFAADSDSARQKVAVAAAAMNSADSVIALASPGISLRTRLMGALTTAMFAAGAAAYAAGALD